MPLFVADRLARSTRGNVGVQWLVVVGCVALAGVGAYRAFGKSTQKVAEIEGQHVLDLTPMSSGQGSSGSGPAGAPPTGPICTGGSCKGGSNCFVAGTPVATPTGFLPIERIHAGDEVLSFREETAEFVVERVGATFVTPDRDVLEVRLRGDVSPLRVTPGHRFFTLDRGWIGAERLDPGEPLVDSAGAAVIVDSLARAMSRETVYNFEVDDTHTYFVGAERVLVHNPVEQPQIDLGNGLPTTVHQPILNNPGSAALLVLSPDPALTPLVDDFTNGHPGIEVLDYNTLHGPHALTGKTDLIVLSHGRPGQITYGNGSMSSLQFANQLANAGYNPIAYASNSEVFVVACNGGTCSSLPSVAQAVANRFNIQTHGPTDTTETGNDPDDPSFPPFLVIDNGGTMQTCQPQAQPRPHPQPPAPTGPVATTFESMGFTGAPAEPAPKPRPWWAPWRKR